MIPRMPTADIAMITRIPTFTSATNRYWLNGRTAKEVSAVNVEMTGAIQKIERSASVGIMSSFSRSLRASAMGCSRPCGPTRMGPRRTWKSASTLRSTSVRYPATSGKTAMITMVTAMGTKRGFWRTEFIIFFTVEALRRRRTRAPPSTMASRQRDSSFQQRTLREPQERLGINAHGQRQHARDSQGETQSEAGRQWSFLRQLPHEHDADNAEVIIDRHGDIKCGDHGQNVMVRLDERKKDVILAQKPGGRRNAGERKQEHQHQDGVARTLVHEARHVVEIFADDIFAPHGDHNQKRAQIHEG